MLHQALMLVPVSSDCSNLRYRSIYCGNLRYNRNLVRGVLQSSCLVGLGSIVESAANNLGSRQLSFSRRDIEPGTFV